MYRLIDFYFFLMPGKFSIISAGVGLNYLRKSGGEQSLRDWLPHFFFRLNRTA